MFEAILRKHFAKNVIFALFLIAAAKQFVGMFSFSADGSGISFDVQFNIGAIVIAIISGVLYFGSKDGKSPFSALKGYVIYSRIVGVLLILAAVFMGLALMFLPMLLSLLKSQEVQLDESTQLILNVFNDFLVPLMAVLGAFVVLYLVAGVLTLTGISNTTADFRDALMGIPPCGAGVGALISAAVLFVLSTLVSLATSIAFIPFANELFKALEDYMATLGGAVSGEATELVYSSGNAMLSALDTVLGIALYCLVIASLAVYKKALLEYRDAVLNTPPQGGTESLSSEPANDTGTGAT